MSSRPFVAFFAAFAIACALLAASPNVARAQEVIGCGKDTDCKFERICRAGQCVDTRAPVEGERREPVPWRPERLGIYLLTTLPVAGDNQPPRLGYSFGLENASRIFGQLRYHFSIGYEGQPTANATQQGLRSEIIGLGYTFTALDTGSAQLGIEPVFYLFNLETYFPSGARGAQVDLGSGWGIDGILGFGDRHGYVLFEPVGMDLRWLQAGDGIPTVVGLGASWRVRIAVGLAF